MSDGCTSECSLLCASPTYRSELSARLEIAAQSPPSPKYSPVSIKLCQLELAFILSKGSHPQSSHILPALLVTAIHTLR